MSRNNVWNKIYMLFWGTLFQTYQERQHQLLRLRQIASVNFPISVSGRKLKQNYKIFNPILIWLLPPVLWSSNASPFSISDLSVPQRNVKTESRDDVNRRWLYFFPCTWIDWLRTVMNKTIKLRTSDEATCTLTNVSNRLPANYFSKINHNAFHSIERNDPTR